MSIHNGIPATELAEVTWHKGPALVFTSAEWAAFVGGARDGDFD